MKSIRFIIAALAGINLGLGIFTFHYGEGLSYLSAEPAACVNCHIMQPQFDSWQKASHHTSAVCVDCHLPHDFLGKWKAKAENGFWHSKGFTFQDFTEPIRIRARNRRTLLQNCLNCHSGLVHNIVGDKQEIDCLHCHVSSGHGEPVGLGKYERKKPLDYIEE